MTKINIKKIISDLKKVKVKPGISDKLTKALVNPMFRERDMRHEAINIGSHQASEFFGDRNESGE